MASAEPRASHNAALRKKKSTGTRHEASISAEERAGAALLPPVEIGCDVGEIALITQRGGVATTVAAIRLSPLSNHIPGRHAAMFLPASKGKGTEWDSRGMNPEINCWSR